MTIRRSQGLCQALLSQQDLILVQGTDIAVATTATVTRTAADFISAGFRVGMKAYFKGFSNAALDISAVITGVAADTLTFASSTFSGTEAATEKVTIMAVDGGSFRALFTEGKMTVYNGTQRTSPDDASGGATALIEWTGLSVADVAWDSTNAQATVTLSAATVNASATGTASWFCLAGKDEDMTSASTTAIRLDGNCGVGTGDLRMATLSITSGLPQDMTAFTLQAKRIG